MECQRCQEDEFVKAAFDRFQRQIHRCSRCGRRQTDRSGSAFSGYRFPDEIIALAVRWYLRFRLPYADIAELLAERGIHVDPSTIYDWVQHFAPLYRAAARTHRHRVGGAWSIDETYLRIAGRWCSAFRAIDQDGQVIDVSVSPTRDTEAAKAFLTRADESTEVTPHVVTIDKAAIYPPAIAIVLPEVDHITGKMEQQGIERDHHHLKGRTRWMRGFQTICSAQVVCEGHSFIRNLDHGFYRLGLPTGDPRGHRAARLVRAWDELTVTLAAA
jgi:transposase-like protein